MTKRAENGFTLVEVLIAMVVFSIGILAVINMQILSSAINVKSRGMTEGIIVAQNKIEDLAALPYTHADLANSNTNGAADNGATGLALAKEALTAANSDGNDVTNPRYTVFWNVGDDMPFTGTKTIRVVVRWSEKGIISNFEIDMMKSDGA